MAATSNFNVEWLVLGVPTEQYTLTGSLVASKPVDVKFMDIVYVYARYLPETNGAGLQFIVDLNPYLSEEDPSDLFWAPYGYYVDATGDQDKNATGIWTEQPATFLSTTATTAGVDVNIVPMPIKVAAVKRLRIRATETGGGVPGLVQFVLAKNEYDN